MTPREFLAQIVEPDVTAFHAECASLRHAYHAVASVDALAAHLYAWAQTNKPTDVARSGDDSAYRTALANRDPQFRMLRDVANAHKHVRLTRRAPKVTESSQTVVRSIGYGEGGYGEGRFGGGEQVIIELAPNDFVYLEAVVDAALAFLVTEMTTLGV